MGLRAKCLYWRPAWGPGYRPLRIRTQVPGCRSRKELAGVLGRYAGPGRDHEARINTHAHAQRVRDFIDWSTPTVGFDLVESFEPGLLGSAGTVAANADLADGADEIVIIYADNLSDIDLRPSARISPPAWRSPDDGLVPGTQPPCLRDRRAGERGKDRLVCREAGAANQRSGQRRTLCRVDAAAYREIAAMGAFDLGFDVLPRFVGRMRGWVWGGYYLDIGTHEALERRCTR